MANIVAMSDTIRPVIVEGWPLDSTRYAATTAALTALGALWSVS